jgi:hypothetical protein
MVLIMLTPRYSSQGNHDLFTTPKDYL